MSRSPEHDDVPYDAPDDATDEVPDTEPGSAPGGAPRPTDRLAAVSGLMASVSTAYTAAHGHPLAHDGLIDRQVRRRRWSVAVRAAVVASLTVALVTGVVVIRDLARTSGAPVPLTEVDPGSGSAPEPVDAKGADPAVAADLPGEESPGPPGSESPVSPELPPVAVHVVGQVASPGVIEVAPGSRVIDAIAAAGGLTDAADAGAVNLARPVVDGEQIYVPVPGEVIPGPVQGGQPAAGPGAAVPGTTTPDGMVNLNTADAAGLDALPGIGPAIAGRIIAWREEHGSFAAVDDLLEVAGIGPSVLAKIRDLVTV